jgi:hypothetical protein
LTMNGRENINSKAVLPSVLLTTTLWIIQTFILNNQLGEAKFIS